MSWSTYTEAEDATILRLRDEKGWTFVRIAALFGQQFYSVYSRYRTLKAVEVSGAALRHPRR